MIDIGIGQLAWWQLILAILVAIIGAARLTRLVTYDDYPPAIALRMWWNRVTDDGPWAKLVHCPWCFGPWAFGAAVISFLLTFVYPPFAWVWWLWWGILAGAYLTSQYVYFDQGKSDD